MSTSLAALLGIFPLPGRQSIVFTFLTWFQYLLFGPGTEFARKRWWDKFCMICLFLCISHKYNNIVCVSITSPCSLNRITTFLNWQNARQIIEMIYFGDYGLWFHGNCTVLCSYLTMIARYLLHTKQYAKL